MSLKFKIQIGFIIFFAGFNICATNAQLVNNTLFKDVFKARFEFFDDSIPDKFKSYYKKAILLNFQTSELLDSVFVINRLYPLLKDSFYLMEFNSSVSSNVYGTIWNTGLCISYVYNSDLNMSKSFQVNFNPYLDPLEKRLIRDIEKWGQSVHDRSFVTGTVADGAYVMCSKILLYPPKVRVETIIFYEYDPDEDHIYHKESILNNYITKFIL